METTENVLSYNKRPPKGISWRAVFAGTVTALSAMLILNLIGIAIGLWSIEPTEESNPLSGLGTGAVIWWVLSNLIVLFLGGFVSARVGVSFTDLGGMIHGVMTWALYTLLSAWLLTSVVGSIISGIGNVIGGVLSPVGDLIQNQVGPMISDQFEGLELSLDDAREEFYSLLEDTGKEELDPDYLKSQAERSARQAGQEATDIAQQPGGSNADVERIFGESKNRFKKSFKELDEQALVNILVERTDMTEAEARRTVENTFARFRQAREDFEAFMEEAKQTANEQAEKIAKAAGDAAMYLSIALILGLAASAFGGFIGVKELREDCVKNNYFADRTDYDREDMM
ncbi:transmembrane 9 family protein [Lunatibacter salilacus]|uniref:hypothetical protein n=1 Tax=Lunatibacter salilacus TaxID=2483804 RepID=UPI00131B12BB|nr:hypothetical protein [Lunatibacter salilacus]